MSEIAIVGAGVGGMTLAIACKQAGLDVRIYESARTCQQSDSVLELTPNGSRILHALGLRSNLAEVSRQPPFATTHNAATGFLLAQRPLGAFSEARYGAPCYLIEARWLITLLSDACEQLGIAIEFNTHVDQIDTASATLTVAGGHLQQHRATVIATGAGSNLSNCLEQRHWDQDADYMVIRARSSTATTTRRPHNNINTWVFPGGCCTELPLEDQRVELLAVIHGSRSAAPAEDELAARLDRCHPNLKRIVEGITQAEYMETLTTQIAEYWYAGRCALLGDVCHAGAPHATYGTAAAMEDAWVLSRMMERWEEEPHQGFADYQRYRKPRAQRLKKAALAHIDELTLSDRGAVWRRNILWSMTSRFLPEIAMQKLDWLHGYDCIKGFA